MATFWRFIVNILHIFSICFPIGFGIYNDWNFTQKNDLVIALLIILFIFGTVGLCLRIGNCAGCDDEDCPLSLYCELQTKVKRVKRLFVFLGYDKEIVNGIATTNYKGHNNYFDIIEITYKKLSETETNCKGYND
jgi:hypothetical protein